MTLIRWRNKDGVVIDTTVYTSTLNRAKADIISNGGSIIRVF